jgi:N-dimethylarginine dimethylaminohydrolase
MVVELRSENKLQDQVIQQNAGFVLSNKAEETAFRSEMRGSVAGLEKLLTDIRIQAAGRK